MTKIRSTRSSRIEDRRGQGGGGGGLSFPGLGGGGGGLGIPMKAGGGILGLIVVLAAVLLPKLLGGGSARASPERPTPAPAAEQSTGVTAVRRPRSTQILCGAVDDVSEYWIVQYPESFGQPYREADTVFFTGGTNTGCGQASSQMGPFYCPADELVYFDLDFLVQMQQQFGAVGDLAAQYIVAHEYGHHVQNVLGDQRPGEPGAAAEPGPGQRPLGRPGAAGGLPRRRLGPLGRRARPARAGRDQRGAGRRGGRRRRPHPVSRPGCSVNPDSFTHGTSEQRVQWFRRGYDTGDPNQCNTFAEL